VNNDSDSRLKFWGVRGSIPTPVPTHLGFGGNTACIELRFAGEILIIDGGTGARGLGLCLQQEFKGSNISVNFLLTHFHWDHIQGLPFFAPLYSPGNEVTFCSGCPAEQAREILEGQMTTPYFPVGFEFLAAKRKFVDLGRGGCGAAAVSISPFPLNHPQGATGFRIESNGFVIVHASDFEHGHNGFDSTLRDYSQDADVLIYDAQYTPEEYASKKGWGHSTWQEATRVARESKVKKLILFHHDPSHDDETLNQILGNARQQFENTDVAKEGCELCL